MNIDPSKAHAELVVLNAMRDPAYLPYCMRCRGWYRMEKVETLLWRHHCGAVHDERQCIVKED